MAADGAPVGEPRSRTGPELVQLTDARWIVDSCALTYPGLLDAGVVLPRCHDITLTERILLSRTGRHGEPAAAAAVVARAQGRPAPADPQPADPTEPPGLFDGRPAGPQGREALPLLAAALADQIVRIGSDNGLRLLVAAESASGLAAVEMGRRGLPLSAAAHERLLVEALGPKPIAGARPAKLAELAAEIETAFGYPVNPDSPADLRAAFQRLGYDIETTRAWVLREIDHPAVKPVLAYKELARLHTANGWHWRTEWVRDGRFHAEYIPGGVVSGRWAARGGGGLQLPKLVRRAVIADPGKVFVVADAAQLEPRVLAAISKDPALQALSGDGDLYTGLAADGFGGDRAQAKLAMLGAMYGQTSGEAGRLLATLRQRYPAAMACVQEAARRGERGEMVDSVLGRRSPRPGPGWWATVQAGSMPEASPAQERRSREVARGWGRFTRNFVVQGSAADWAAVWLSGLRMSLLGLPAAELVFFQHDELVVHVPTDLADRVCELTVAAAEDARRLVFPGATARTPVRPVVVGCYADAK